MLVSRAPGSFLIRRCSNMQGLTEQHVLLQRRAQAHRNYRASTHAATRKKPTLACSNDFEFIIYTNPTQALDLKNRHSVRSHATRVQHQRQHARSSKSAPLERPLRNEDPSQDACIDCSRSATPDSDFLPLNSTSSPSTALDPLPSPSADDQACVGMTPKAGRT